VEAQALIDTVEDHELTDPSIVAERLLYRLFHERGVRVFEPISIEENCSCSRERIGEVLMEMSASDIDEAAAASGAVEVRCEFCGANYSFDPKEIEAERA
jgi:molecular chaperone Hsp33